MIRFLCPTCSAKVQAPELKIAQSGRCPRCGGMFVVPPVSAPQFAAIPQADSYPPPFAQRAFAPPGFAQPGLMPPPFSAAPRKRNLYLLPIAIGGALILGLVFALTQMIERNTRQSASKLPTMRPRSTSSPPQNYRPTPTPPNRQQPQQPSVDNRRETLPQPRASTPAVTPNPLPRLTAKDNFDPRAQYGNSAPKPIVPAKRLQTAPLLLPLVRVDQRVYAASKDGDFYTIDIESVQIVEQKKLDPLKLMYLRGSQLKAQKPSQGPPFTILEFNKTVDVENPEDVDANEAPALLGGNPVPAVWFAREHYFNQVVSYKGRYFQPMPQGVRVLENGIVTVYPSSVVSLRHWKIALLPSGPMGYDTISLYTLDENLCPTTRLIQLSTNGSFSANECFVVGDGKTFCYVQQSDIHKRMTVWSSDGKRKIRELPVSLGRDGDDAERSLNRWEYRPPSRLMALDGGYLYCGRQMTWMPSGAGDVLQFQPTEQPPAQIRSRFGMLNLTPPLVVGHKVFVGYGGGGIYVFDTSAFSSGSAADSNPPGSRGGL